MLKQCLKLFKVQLLHMFQINEIIHSKDKRKKRNAILLAFTMILLGLCLMLYVGIMAASLSYIDMTSLIPGYMFATTSVLTMVFTIFKASSVLFGSKDYDLLTAMPIKPWVIVVSRFLTMYVSNLVLTLITMIPSALVYGIFAKPGFGFYLMTTLGLFFIPFIPMTLATAVGAVVTGISSRMKHRTLFVTVISIFATVGIIVLSLSSGNVTREMISDLTKIMTEQINSMYFLAPLYTDALVNGSLSSYILFIFLSIIIFAIFVKLISWKFNAINSALSSKTAKGNYVLKDLEISSPLKALYKKEMKRYLSSSLYVLNTGIGYIMMVIFAVAVLIVGIEKMEAVIEMPGLSKIFISVAPIMLGMMASIMTTTVSSISIEGKQWWIAQSLPVKTKTVFDSKILINLTIALPCSVIASTLIAFAVSATWLSLLLLYFVPVIYILFTTIMGITINAHMPTFNWDNEAYVIKQSAPVLIAMLVGMSVAGIPIALIFVLNILSSELIVVVVSVILSLVTVVLYSKNNKMELKLIQQQK